jgi:hypothetical protein
MTRWRKKGTRWFCRDTKLFNAIIFGATAPLQLWAWAVYSHGQRREGVEFSLSNARSRANIVIEELEKRS